MSENIISNTCASCGKKLFAVILAVVLLGVLVTSAAQGLFLAGESVWRGPLGLLWRDYYGLVASKGSWFLLTLWAAPAGLAIWAHCTASKLEEAKVYKPSRIFAISATLLASSAWLVLTPIFKTVPSPALSAVWPLYTGLSACTLVGVLIASTGTTKNQDDSTLPGCIA